MVALWACARPQSLEVGEISVDEAPATLGDVAAAVRSALQADQAFRVVEGKPPEGAWQCEARVTLEDGERDEMQMRVRVELSHSGAERRARLTASAQRPAGSGSAARRQAFQAALTEVVRRLAANNAALGRGDQALQADLGAGDEIRREAAVQALAMRKSGVVVPLLIERLRSADDEQVLSAVGMLVHIRDRRAVEPLLALARGRDAEFVIQIAYALAELGGPEAEAWLFTQARGAEDPRVRGAAARASQEMARRTGAEEKAKQ